jgi:hypothetical protein
MDKQMKDAYRAAKRISDGQLPREEADLLQAIDASQVVVVRGQYDRVEDVLAIMEIPHRVIDEAAVARAEFHPRQMVIVNRPGAIQERGVAVLKEFVAAGGHLFTTDWALKHMLERAFPGVVAHNGRQTGDEVVRIEVRDARNPYVAGVFHEGDDPLWWLESSSYPIRVLAPEAVSVLIASRELEARHGEAPVAVSFPFGQGEVTAHDLALLSPAERDTHGPPRVELERLCRRVGVALSRGSPHARIRPSHDRGGGGRPQVGRFLRNVLLRKQALLRGQEKGGKKTP